MLTIEIPGGTFWDEQQECFFKTDAVTLNLEHSLISLSKWESKWHKPFLSMKEKTPEEMLDYVRCMTLNKNVSPLAYKLLTQSDFKRINEYIDDKATATWFSDDKKKNKRRSREVITAEIIYWWMIAQQIPFECQKWHLNKLLTLVRVCSIKNEGSKKMSPKAIGKQNAKLNAARHAAHQRRG